MQDFQFVKAGEVAGGWKPGNVPTWRTKEGELFFLATWSKGQNEYGWFGIYHESLEHLDDDIHTLASTVTKYLEQFQSWNDLAGFSRETPGWGLVRSSKGCVDVLRDPIGRLPVWWATSNEEIEWGTRPTMLKRFDGRFRRSRIEAFLARTKDYGRDDYWQGIGRIRAGECLRATGFHRPTFMDWWPDDLNSSHRQACVEQRVADLLTKTLDRIAKRGGQLVSLSGGVDSTLLLALLASKHRSPCAISMVAPDTQIFDERKTIETSLAEIGCKGHFFDISGPLDWSKSDCHHVVSDFGPSAHSESAYVRPLLREVCRLVRPNASRILISGAGADQVFNCSQRSFISDSIDDWGGELEVIGRGDWKTLVKSTARQLGWTALPARMGKRTGPPWLGTQGQLLQEDLILNPIYERRRWLRNRRRQFKSSYWESTVRFFEQYRRATGVLYELPFLTPQLVDFALSLSPKILRTMDHRKIVLRNLLRGRVSDTIAFRPKYGQFDEVVWRGLSKFFQPPIDDLLTDTYLERYGWARESPLREYASKIERTLNMVGRRHWHEFWRAIAVELWIHQVRE